MPNSVPAFGDPNSAQASGHLSDGLQRLSAIIKPNGPIPVGKSTWWAGVKSGRFPAPVRLGPRIVAWRTSQIEQLIERGVSEASLKPERGRS